MADLNRDVYEDSESVQVYHDMEDLQKPEQHIFSKLDSFLRNSRVLDIGMGAGRTSQFLIPACREYIGVDYSKKMVEMCQERFQSSHPEAKFSYADAREMNQFDDDSFDFVIFSFNGIDSVDHDDRQRILNEVKRVTRPGGFFCFSSHNIFTDLSGYHSLKWNWSPIEAYRTVKRWWKFRTKNPDYNTTRKNPHAIFCDGALAFSVRNYYIRPSLQVACLKEMDFSEVEVYSVETGKQIPLGDVDQLPDAWVYYLARLSSE